MRATQFVRRGLIAFATVALFSAGLAGAASAQTVGTGSIGCGTAGVSPAGDAIVVGAVPGFSCQLITTPGFGETAILGVSLVPSGAPVVVQFIPDVNGAGVIDPINGNVIAPRP